MTFVTPKVLYTISYSKVCGIDNLEATQAYYDVWYMLVTIHLLAKQMAGISN